MSRSAPRTFLRTIAHATTATNPLESHSEVESGRRYSFETHRPRARNPPSGSSRCKNDYNSTSNRRSRPVNGRNGSRIGLSSTQP